MTQPPQPTEPFAQHPGLAELVTAVGFRRDPLFLAGLLYQEPGGPLRRATAVASRDGDLVAYDAGEVFEHTGRVPTSRLFDDDPTRAVPGRPWWTPWPTAARRSSPTRWPAGPGAAAASTRSASSCCTHWFRPQGPAPAAITGSEVLGVVPLEATHALLDEFHRLADHHQRSFLVERVMELLATS